jgi:DNA-binding NarL/FixJ family response regulator
MSSRVIDSHMQNRRRLQALPDQRVRVVIADHDGLARSMMRAALADASGIATVASTGDGREALQLVRYYRPAVLTLDTGLLSNGRVELVRAIRLASPETRVLTISIDDDRTALAALRAGAAGHLSKDINPRKLAALVARVAAGEAIIPRHLTRPLLELLRQLPETGWRPLHSVLTNREWQIVELLGDGASTQDIADRLVLSPTTIYSHVKSLLHKLGVHSRQDAVRAAQRLRREEALGEKATPSIPSESPRSPDQNRHPSVRREKPAANLSALRAGVPKRQGTIGR